MPEASLELLRRVAQLRSVGFPELSAVRSGVEAAPVGNVPITPQYALNIEAPDPADEFHGFALTIRLTIAAPQGHATVAVVGHYVVPDQTPHHSPAVVTAFANSDGVPTLLPFIRAELSDLTTRVFGAPIVMPLMQPGELEFPAPQQ